MTANVRAVIENGSERAAADQQKPASKAVIMDSLVATEAELKALYEDIDQSAAMSYRMSPRPTGI